MHAWSCDPPPGVRRALSPVQRRFWFLGQRFGGWRGLVVADAYRLDGALDARVLSDSLAATLGCSQDWTWTVTTEQGVPHVTVAARPVVDWRFVDLSGGGPDHEARVAAVLDEHAREPLALEGGPAVRCVLVRLSPVSHAVLLAAHRARADEVAMDALWSGLARVYGEAGVPGVGVGGEGGVPGVTGPARADGSRRERFWRDALAGARALELPVDRPRPEVPGPAGGLAPGRITRRGTGRLAELAARLGQPVEAAVLAAFGTLLGRHCGQDDVVVAVPAAPGRTAVAAGGGACDGAGDVLPVRLDLSGDPPFGDLVARAGGALAAARAQGGAFDQIVRWSGAARWADRMPLAQAACAVGPPRPRPAALAGTAVQRLPLPPEPPLGEVALEVAWQPGDHPRAALRYDAGLFDPSTVRGWARHLGNLADGARTDVPLSCLPLASGGERHWVRQRCTGLKRDLPAPTVVEAIERTVRAAPQRVAAEHGGGALTYGELSRRAYRLAHHLRALGCGPETPVALLAERSLDFAVATLGIVYASATCVPVDTTYPPERISQLLRGSGALVAVTHGNVPDAEVVRAGAEVVRLDADAARRAGQPGQRPPFDASPGNLAYVLYTSGSTGIPRAVGLEHAGLANAVAAAAERYGIEASERMLQFASLSFDISLEEMLTAWTVGATVVFRPADMDVAGQRWLDWLRDRRITACSIPTAYWHGWVADLVSLGATVPEALRTVVIGGERAHAAAYRQWLRAGGDRVRFFNTYGPTEATITATAVELHGRDGEVPYELPIGSPLPNTQVYVLDECGQEAPVGITGELYLGGVQLARGYLGSPSATAERFVPHPFATTPGERLYRTGDLARLRADGQFAFCGRVDTQVKVRGFRVEPGEVESALRGHPAVADAAVVACLWGAAVQLVGYTVLARTGAGEGAGPTGAALREFLRQRLPEHLVPAQVTVVGELPLTPNGKVDRDALTGPRWTGETDSAPADAGADAIEAALSSLWCETLGVPAARRDDGFFESGGDSYQAVRLAAGIEREFGVALGVRSLFANPLLHQLAAAVRAGVAEEPDGSAAERETGGEGAAPDATALITGIWQELLGVADISADDDFFELGGQSLLAIQTVALAREQGVEIPLRLIFDHPKAGDLARAVAALPHGVSP